MSPYVTGIGITGKAAAVPGVPPGVVNASFSHILNNLDLGAMIAATARIGRFAAFGNLHYGDIAARGSTEESVYSDAESDVQNAGSSSWRDGLVGLRGCDDTGPRSYLTDTPLVNWGGSGFGADMFAGPGQCLSDRTSLDIWYQNLTKGRPPRRVCL